MRSVHAVVLLSVLFAVEALGQREQPVVKGFGEPQLILRALTRAGVSGSLEYTGKCGPDVLVPDMPPVREPQESPSLDAVNILRSMFPADGRMAVFRESDGTIRAIEAGVRADILRVRISHISFNAVSDPDQALHVVLSTPEVQSFMQNHHIGQPFNIYDPPLYTVLGRDMSPRPGMRSISSELNDVTLVDALDYILKTFPGFWLYQDCEGVDKRRIVYFGLFPVPARMWLWENGSTLVK
jgi:hypothetical protein